MARHGGATGGCVVPASRADVKLPAAADAPVGEPGGCAGTVSHDPLGSIAKRRPPTTSLGQNDIAPASGLNRRWADPDRSAMSAERVEGWAPLDVQASRSDAVPTQAASSGHELRPLA